MNFGGFMGNVLLVGVGGFVGSVLRYLVGGLVQQWSHREEFPVGTLAVNVIGCFLIGLLSQLSESHGPMTPQARALLVIGILGGFTTFSSFGNETVNLFRGEHALLAVMNVFMQVGLGLAAVWFGRFVSFKVWG
jgi:CrcB protein